MENELIHDQSDHSVTLRRDWVAEKYFKHIPPRVIFMEYNKLYNLSKHSFDKDIAYVRSHISVDVYKDYSDLMNDQINILIDTQQKAIADENTPTVLDCSKKIVDIIKLVTPRQTSTGNGITFNTQNNNVKLPDNLSLDQIRSLLQGDNGKIIEIKQ